MVKKLERAMFLNSNRCYNKIIKVNNEYHIIKENYTGSSTIEIEEILLIENKLLEFKDRVNCIVENNKIILKLK